MSQPSSLEKKQEWKNLIHKQKESGLPVKCWCRENKISFSKFYYWKKRLLSKPLSRLCFTELTDKKTAGIIIECKGAYIYLDRCFDPLTLKRCLSALEERC